MRTLIYALAIAALSSGCSEDQDPTASDGGSAGQQPMAAGATSSADVLTYGEPYSGGQFHLGPVDYTETEWHNACAPGTQYAPVVREAQGTMLTALWDGIPNVSSYCDACIKLETARGKRAMLRVVSYGQTTANSVDVSPEAFQILDSGEFPRAMTWQFAKCPDTGKIMYEFQAEAHEWWTSLWVRNARVPIATVEAKSANHDFTALARGSDGTLTDARGFGKGPFSIRVTGIDGQVLTHAFEWPSGGVGGQILTAPDNFE